MKYSNMTQLESAIQDIKPSHQEATRIKQGWQMDMYEKEITNYGGSGPVMRVYAKTAKEAEELAALVCAKIKHSVSLTTDVYGDLIPA